MGGKKFQNAPFFGSNRTVSAIAGFTVLFGQHGASRQQKLSVAAKRRKVSMGVRRPLFIGP